MKMLSAFLFFLLFYFFIVPAGPRLGHFHFSSVQDFYENNRVTTAEFLKAIINIERLYQGWVSVFY